MPGLNTDPPGPPLPLRNASRNIRRARIAVRPTRYAPLEKLVRLKKPRLPSALGLSGACGVQCGGLDWGLP
eukprot:scaffold7098_cov124-Isochrysis_galbana.AAC.3